MDYINNESIMDDKPRERRVIHLLDLVFNHSESTHEQYVRIMDDIALPWMENHDKFY